MSSRNRLDPDSEVFIDGLRGLLAIAVLISHAVDLGIYRTISSDMETTPVLWRVARATIGHGGFYVWVFFVISGLCIHQSIARAMAQGCFRWRSYLFARATRLYPLYLVGLLLAVIALPHAAELTSNASVHPWRQLVASLFMMHGFTDSFPGFSPSWSLANEAAYYFVWPMALIMAANRQGKAVAYSLVGLLVPAACVACVWWIFGPKSVGSTLNGFWVIGILFPTWLAGAILAMNWEKMSQWVTIGRWKLGIAMSVAAALLLSIAKYYDVAPKYIDLMSCVSIPGIVIVLAGGHHLRLAGDERLAVRCKRLGLLSYPCYILHMPLMCLTDWAAETVVPGWVLMNVYVRILSLLLPSALVLIGLGPWAESRLLAWRAVAIQRSTRKPFNLAIQ